MRMYHPGLGREADIPDEPSCVAVHEAAGWEPAPEPEAPSPAHAVEPVTYAPVGDKPKGRKAT